MSAAQEMPPDQVPEPGTEIALLDRPLTAALVFAPGGVTSLLDAMTRQVRATEIDVTTPKGRTACKSLAYKVSRSKTMLDQMGKDLDEELRARIKATNAERATIRERLDALRDEVLAPVVEFEAQEERRVAMLRQHLADISWPPEQIAELTIEQMAERIEVLRLIVVDYGWQEFRQKAADAYQREITLTTVALEAAQQREAEAARIAAEQEAEDRRLAALAAERARVEAVEAEHRRQTEAAAQAERDRAAAVAAEHARQVEAAEQVRRVADRERLAADQRAQRAEQERVSAEARAAEAVRRADADRAAAAERADQDRRAAVRAEQERVARVHEQEQAAAAAREADKTHKASRNNEVVADLMLVAGLGKDSAKAVVVALASRKIRHTTISY
jgi:colicin import membrane protein